MVRYEDEGGGVRRNVLQPGMKLRTRMESSVVIGQVGIPRTDTCSHMLYSHRSHPRHAISKGVCRRSTSVKGAIRAMRMATSHSIHICALLSCIIPPERKQRGKVRDESNYHQAVPD